VEYVELPPRAELRPFVRVLWSLRAVAEAGPPVDRVERVVPDGCPEIVVNRGDRFRRVAADGRGHRQARILLVGPIRRAIGLEPGGVVDLVGIRFEPGGLFGVLGMPVHELADVDVTLRVVAPGLRDGLVDAVRERDLGGAIGGLERALLEQIGRRRRVARSGASGVVRAAVEVMRGTPPLGFDGVDGVARRLGVGRRALERVFRREVGLSPKTLQRILRLQGVLAELEGGRGPRMGWADLALRHGYADQPHLIRDFRILAGTSPGRFLAEQRGLAGFFDPAGPSRSSNP